ncbi:MAG: polyamine ABC transporter substrate-binding protein [Carbonactinosporaceae bacterium]
MNRSMHPHPAITGPSRRRFLRGAGAAGAALAASRMLAACGTEPTTKAAGERAAKDRSATEKLVNWSNWPLYIDVNEKTDKHPSLEQFRRATDVRVNYTEDVNDNDEFFGKVRPQLAAGQDTGRDLFVLTDWMAARLTRLGWVQKLDMSNIPNAKNLVPTLQQVPFDPNRSYSLPWQSGMTGIGYNARATGREIKTIDELLTDPKLKGRVTMLTEMRDTMGLVLLSDGKDPSNFSSDDFEAAIDKLQKAVDSGQIRQFTGNDYAPGLNKGDIAAAVVWSGDVIQLEFSNPDVKFVAPESGVMLWSDNMLIPNKARHKTNAEKLMNFYYRPEIAAEVAAYVNYICPVRGAQQAMKKFDPSLVDNQLIFPSEPTLDNAYAFKSLNEDEEKRYNDMFQKVIGA